MLYDFDDLLIEPASITPIRSRSEVNPFYLDFIEQGVYENRLPLMTAPMDTVVCDENKHYFKDLGFTVVLPRRQSNEVSYDDFYSYGLNEFDEIFLNNTVVIPEHHQVFALIDVANGHMQDLRESTKLAKQKYGDQLVLMVGNIANPSTFYEYALTGVDYVRIGIGNGGGCLTTVQTGVGYPMASLIYECNKIKKGNTHIKTKIVADGGFKKYADVIKALALGADYVMLGSILNKSLESCGETTREASILNNNTLEDGYLHVDQYSEFAKECFDADIPLYKMFRGMSTKEVQQSWGRNDLKTSEGVVRKHKVEYTLQGWTDNFVSYLKSAMSYVGKKELPHFIGGVKTNLISENSFNRFNK
jgi:IMP dehydrogenase/GMP reductase